MTSTQTDLFERYLQAIGEHLPAASREDTLAELRVNLLEQLDARAEELGRPLDDNEVSAILCAHGHPMAVAARYLPQRQLIGSVLFPSYLMTLRRVAPWVALIYAIVTSMGLVASPPASVDSSRVVHSILGLFSTLFAFWVCITLAFAAIEFAQGRYGRGKSWFAPPAWDPKTLPAIKIEAEDSGPKSVPGRVADLIIHCLWMAYVFAIPSHPFLMLGPGVRYLDSLGVRFAPVWHTFFIFLIALLLIQLMMKLLALSDPRKAALRWLKLATTVLAVCSSVVMAASGQYFVAASPAADLHNLASVNGSISTAFRIALVFALIGLLVDGWKTAKRWLPTVHHAF